MGITKKGLRMKQVLLAVATTFALAGASQAADLSAELGVDFTQNANDKIVAETSIDLMLTAPMGVAALDLVANGDTIEVDGYAIGTVVSGVGVSFGDQGDLLGGFEGKMETVGGSTLANLDDDGESLKLTAYGISAMIGLTDVTSDVTDVKNIQGTYAIAMNGVQATGGVDYNLDSEEITLLSSAGYAVGQFGIGLTGTYQVEAEDYAYEADVTAYGITGFVNGDKDDMLQNVGAGWTGDLNGMGIYAEAGYNLDSEELTPAAGVSFNF